MGFVDALSGNTTLLEIEFSRNDINEDTAMGIIQRLYFNPCLKRLDLGGNPISTGLFKQNVIKPFFSTRKDLKIVLG